MGLGSFMFGSIVNIRIFLSNIAEVKFFIRTVHFTTIHSFNVLFELFSFFFVYIYAYAHVTMVLSSMLKEHACFY